MELSEEVKAFFNNHSFADLNVHQLSQALYKDMELGLQESNKSQQLMAVMPFAVNNCQKSGKTIVIDAGGTNFRSCLVEFGEKGGIQISDERKSPMIALDREYSKQEFFEALENKISYLKDKAEEIHFCFSYAMKSLPDGDAQVLAFSKQVMAGQVIGCYIGKELKQVLKQKGWTTVKKIKVINDAVACLCSGLSQSDAKYDFYAGFILGTGINNAYIQKGTIGKLKDDLSEHAVVCECGMLKEIPQSDFDKTLDFQSTNPGCSLLEKMCSGAYLGKIAQLAITAACKDKLFTYNFARNFENISDLSAFQMDLFLNESGAAENVLENVCVLSAPEDRQKLTQILNYIILRDAKIAAAVIAATVLKSAEAGGSKACVICNGSTFWKTHNLKNLVETLLTEELTEKNNITFNLVKIENDITLGTALV